MKIEVVCECGKVTDVTAEITAQVATSQFDELVTGIKDLAKHIVHPDISETYTEHQIRVALANRLNMMLREVGVTEGIRS